MSLLLSIEAQLFAFVNIYVPPPFSKSILYTVCDRLSPYVVTRLIKAGDFNGIQDRTLDTSNPTRLPDSELGQWAEALLKVWANLPLTLIGKINLIQMK